MFTKYLNTCLDYPVCVAKALKCWLCTDNCEAFPFSVGCCWTLELPHYPLKSSVNNFNLSQAGIADKVWQLFTLLSKQHDDKLVLPASA